MDKVKIEFEFEFGNSNGTMAAIIRDHSGTVTELTDREGKIMLDVPINFPNSISIELSGKSPSDTKVVDGEIVADKYVHLKRMVVGGIPVTEVNLFKILQYHHDGITTSDPYWGFNGEVVIDFDHDSFIGWHLKNQNGFEFR